jgi:hypothetical protein
MTWRLRTGVGVFLREAKGVFYMRTWRHVLRPVKIRVFAKINFEAYVRVDPFSTFSQLLETKRGGRAWKSVLFEHLFA